METAKNKIRPAVNSKEAKKQTADVKNNGKPANSEAQIPRASETATQTPQTVQQPQPNPPEKQAEQQPAPAENKELNFQISAEKPVFPALNLESTLKVVQDLHLKTIQRKNLLDRIIDLESFVFSQQEDSDELEINHFQGCVLILKDEKGRQFTTNTPKLIKMVVEFTKNTCLNRLAEIEANIVFPKA